jgi:hypothetical protein
VNAPAELLRLVDVDASRSADCALDDIGVADRRWNREHRRPATITAREALAAVRFEALLLWVAWGNLLAGVELTDADRDRCTLAMQRIEAICGEVLH